MPFASNSELPGSVKDHVPAEGQSLMREVLNSQLDDGSSEEVAFSSAWAALQRAGYERQDDGQWVKKNLTPSDVHVPSAGKEDDEDAKQRRRRTTTKQARELVPRGDGTADMPFPVRTDLLGHLRPDQVPRLLGAITHPGNNDEWEFEFERLSALQNRVDEAKVRDIADGGDITGPAGVVARIDDEYVILDGHHRIVARWLAGESTVKVNFIDLEPVSNRMKALTSARVLSYVVEARRGNVEKRQLSEDVFTTMLEAQARAMELGFDDASIHVHQHPDGQAVYMPGPDHEAYVAAVVGEGVSDDGETSHNPSVHTTTPALDGGQSGGLLGTFITYLEQLVGKGAAPAASSTPEASHQLEGAEVEWEVRCDVSKADGSDDERMVWGWASVISIDGEPVEDLQNDVITADELVKFTTNFMLDVRAAKAMHMGEQVGEVVHSFPMTNELKAAFGITCDKEGWIIAQKIHDRDTWKRYKSGELRMFSIGGTATSVPMEDAA